jgi:NAD(P)-dependent dehydrogenase (short-subunit alcohol dehydrogenase family)
MVSSVGHANGPVRFEDVDLTREPYDPWLAYAQSKTANILFAVEAAKRWAADGIAVNAVNPGRIAQGAATSVLLAASPLVEGVTGKYFEDCQEAVPFTPGVPPSRSRPPSRQCLRKAAAEGILLAASVSWSTNRTLGPR